MSVSSVGYYPPTPSAPAAAPAAPAASAEYAEYSAPAAAPAPAQTGPQPLNTSGPVGTKVNTVA
jgi:hypothetical protein